MKISRKGLFWAILLLGSMVLIVPSAALFFLTHQKNILSLTEQKIGDILGARVRIGALKVGFLNEVDATGIQIQEKNSKLPVSFDVDQIKVRYNWLSLFQGKSINPARIILKTPSFRLGSGRFPFEYLRSLRPSNAIAAMMPAVEFNDGTMEFELKTWKQKIRATHLSATFQARPDGSLQVAGATVLEGLAAGKIEFRGSVDPQRESYDIAFHIPGIRFSKNFPVPLEEVQGDWRLTKDRLELTKVEMQVYGWKVKVSGKVWDLPLEPKFHFEAGSPGAGHSVKLEGSLLRGHLEAAIKRKGHHVLTLQGELESQSDHLRLTQAVLNQQYQGEILLDFMERVLKTHFEEIGTRYRWDLHYELRQANAEIQVQLDHYDFSGLDITTDMTISLKPIYLIQQGRLWKFGGGFNTHYFIVETAPLDDFHGQFELTSEGVQNLSASWGKHFEIAGKGCLKGSTLDGDLEIQIHDYDVAGVETFLSKPLPKKLGGVLSGKMQIRGLFPRPNISGHLSIQDGLLGELEYDLAMIQIAGIPPLLYLKDSKVYRGRTKLDLTGMINLTLPNILHDIRYQQPDNLIAYKAFQWEAAEGDIEVKKRGINLPSIAIKAGAGSGVASQDENKDKQSREKYIAVGPKIRF